ncbi:hypothetical protein CYMTET_35332 [Cymbomonas tetramitiformis]|uniref:PKD/REJ-like domain-containing protein n=1 Tax=Cymbomonas tetramitiformis TaxID=36881 RepID=A0AAE0KP92_9CHLO|nr:hypothetical protein CYMTET_35332 [Cymbomonas tetramitiformis]
MPLSFATVLLLQFGAIAEISIHFLNADLADFANETYFALFESSVQSTMSASADTEPEFVQITSIQAASVALNITTAWSFAGLAAGASPQDFTELATVSPSSMFAQDPILSPYIVETVASECTYTRAPPSPRPPAPVATCPGGSAAQPARAGFECGTCPEGYRSQGPSCVVCSLEVRISSSTAVEGVMRHSARNEVLGQLIGLDSPRCSHTQGTRFAWHMRRSDGTPVALDDATHNANTLKLNLPKGSLAVGTAYRATLSAALTGNSEVQAVATLMFFVRGEPLRVIVTGGGAEMGSPGLLRLDATASYDPNDGGGAHAFMFSWQCSQGTRGEGPCRDAQGAPLPAEISAEAAAPLRGGEAGGAATVPGLCVSSHPGDGGSTNCAIVATTLQGGPEGVLYSFTCVASKGDLSARVEAITAVVYAGYTSPSIAVTPLDPARALPDADTLLLGEVAFGEDSAADSQWMRWEVHPESPLDLEAVALTPLTQASLVVQKGTLSPGATYRFTLRAGDAGGAGACTMMVRVNQAPWHVALGGAALEVRPSDAAGGRLGAKEEALRRGPDGAALGVALEDHFTCELCGWTDDPDDLPLTYQVSYQVEGRAGAGRVVVDYTPSSVLTFVVPEAGLEDRGRGVVVRVSIRDRLGASNSSSVTVRVTSPELESPEAEARYIDALLERSATSAGNGNAEGALVVVDGVALMLNSGSAGNGPPARRLASLPGGAGVNAGQTLSDRRAQRERAADLMGQVLDAYTITESSLEQLSLSAATLLRAPREVSDRASSSMLSVLGALVDASLDGDDRPDLREDAAASICDGLSNLTLVQANASAQPAASLRVLERLAESLAQPLVAGQQAVQVSSEALSASVQVRSASGLLEGVLSAAALLPVPGRNGSLSTATLALPASVAPVLEGVTADGTVRAQLTTSRSDPHAATAVGAGDSATGAAAVTDAALGSDPVVSITLREPRPGESWRLSIYRKR